MYSIGIISGPIWNPVAHIPDCSRLQLMKTAYWLEASLAAPEREVSSVLMNRPELPKELNQGICSKSYRDSKYDLAYIA